jgi:hypothetical protein
MAKAKDVKVYLLNVEPALAGRVFYAEAPGDEAGEEDEATGHGLRGWAEAKLRRVKANWRQSRGRAAVMSRKVWDWLERHAHPDEALLARLRSARAIELHHPASLSGDEVGAAWSAFLAGGRRRHWPWFLVHALAAPLSVVLAPMPGPNLVGYWFVYRAIHHWLILVGLGRARRGRVPTRFRPSAALDAPVAPAVEGGDPVAETARLVALGCDPGSVAAFLRRHGIPPARDQAVDTPATGAGR